MEENPKDWKLLLRYGKLKTEFQHFTILADGIVGDLIEGFECEKGRAWMSMKTWALDTAQSTDMAEVIGREIGFTVDGEIQVFTTEPETPPGEKPHGYDIRFTPYNNYD